ncbi:uncharacterized protein LOC127837043 [Dreissena polymorpha]|uniref:uncharacterized protein LOC127837043 n=1 Tax=Dreissena polymorpha TaxID=45954 RepID=UPI002263EABF|nr:uncharacterized protein LOC127837043 [Dreissena polymorpha]
MVDTRGLALVVLLVSRCVVHAIPIPTDEAEYVTNAPAGNGLTIATGDACTNCLNTDDDDEINIPNFVRFAPDIRGIPNEFEYGDNSGSAAAYNDPPKREFLSAGKRRRFLTGIGPNRVEIVALGKRIPHNCELANMTLRLLMKYFSIGLVCGVRVRVIRPGRMAGK